MYVCKICKECPNSHSFYMCEEHPDHNVYYSCPAKSLKPKDHDGIISHYAGMLNDKKDKKWIWIIDGKDSKTQMLDLKIVLSLVKLCEKQLDSLIKIIVINLSLPIKTLLCVINPFLSTKLKSVIYYE